jgi:hypothetical protein
VSDDGMESNRGSQRIETGYEPPEVFDFGPVFEVTLGSSGQNNDDGARQQFT